MGVFVREATAEDAEQMSHILQKILVSWNSERPSSADHVLAHYVESPTGIRCSVACDPAGDVVGFQSLGLAEADNPYDLPAGWGYIGTYVDAKMAGQGVGKALFASSLEAAQEAKLQEIDATIGETNAPALAYYNALGFRSYRTMPGAIGKKFTLG